MNIGFVGYDYKWFIGQVPPNQLANKTEKGAWGDRVRIKIPGYHSRDKGVDNDNLPWAIIAKPTSQGSYNYGSTGLSGGEWVIGFFLDEDYQVPVITHVLGSSQVENTITLEEAKAAGTTYFKNVTRYNYGVAAQIHQQKGGSKPTAAAQPTKKDFDASKEKGVTSQSADGIPREPRIIQNPDGSTTVQVIGYNDHQVGVVNQVQLQPGSSVPESLYRAQAGEFNSAMSSDAAKRGDEATASYYADLAAGRNRSFIGQ